MPLVASEIDLLLQRATELAARYLEANNDRATPVVNWTSPREMRKLFQLAPPRQGGTVEDLFGELERVLDRSVRTGHPYFFNQLFGGYDPAAIVGEWMAAVVNSSMYTYEAAPVFTLMEEALIARMNELAGIGGGEGIFTPGGSISNLMAVLAARNKFLPEAKRRGIKPGDRLVMFHSAEAHYSLARAASVVGIGLEGARAVPVDAVGRMIPEELDLAVAAARAEGLQPFLVVATSGTTVACAFDPLPPIAEIARRHGLWFHVDAAFGGGVLFSRRFRALMEGCDAADSITWNPHKGLGVPLPCSALLVREKGRLKATHALHADYLFHDTAEASCDRGDMTLQCGRRVDALKLWLSWRLHGDAGYEQRVDRQFALAREFRDLVASRPGFALWREPEGCTVCFHYLPPSLRGACRDQYFLPRLEQSNIALRERLKHDGRIMLNYAKLSGVHCLRLVLINPAVSSEDLKFVLDELERLGAGL